ncbi:MAG TPA: ParB/RepB/Spo0J family partition protein [Acetobacteraceae bacterium]|nr:ParB/RepB/Spo0J family partition protein [Acetobacteraceae bacterium]
MSPRENTPRLGRGLAALLGEGTARSQPGSAEQASVRLLPLDLLEPGPFQPRSSFQEPALHELAASIRRRGILQPLLARPHPSAPDRYQIVTGERRWRAAAMAGLHAAPVLVRELGDSDALAVALVENLQRQDLNPLEEAEGYNRLIEEFGLTQEQLADAVGKSRAHIGNMLRLLNATPKLRDALRQGVVTAGHARALLTHPEPDQALTAVIANQMSVRETEALAAARRSEPTERRPRDADLVALERELSAALGLKIEISGTLRRGTVRIGFEGADQLEGILTKLRA